MQIDDIVMWGKQSVYSVDILQIRKRNVSLIRCSIANSFNFSQGRAAGEEKKETACSRG